MFGTKIKTVKIRVQSTENRILLHSIVDLRKDLLKERKIIFCSRWIII